MTLAFGFFFEADALLFLFKPRRIISFIRNSVAAVEFENPACNVIEEVAVVGDGDDGAFVVAQVMFEPRHGLGVEVVGGFVEQENIGFSEQESGEGDAALFSTRADLDGRIRRRAAQGVHGEFKAAVEIPGVVLVEFFLQFGLLCHEGVEIGVGFGEFGVDLIEAREHFDDGLHRFFDAFDDGFGFVEFGFLLEQPVGVAFGLRDLADVVFVDACHDAQQGRFARAVKTEHADLGAEVEAERDVAQDLFIWGDEASHFVHGVNYEGFIGHSGSILPDDSFFTTKDTKSTKV